MPRVEGESRFASLRINRKEPGVESVQGMWKKLDSKWIYLRGSGVERWLGLRLVW